MIVVPEKGRLKVAVYGISKNEEYNIERFVTSAREADLISITDTGSTDKTVQSLKDFGAEVHETLVVPWRFDEARNRALDNLPKDFDVCISVDLDESFVIGWRESLENQWRDATIGNYRYVADFEDEAQTKPKTTCWRSKIHCRESRWQRPVHEIVLPIGEKKFVNIEGFTVLHHRIHEVNYVGLLDVYIKDNPEDADAYVQRGADYLRMKEYEKSIADYSHYLKIVEPVNEDMMSRRCYVLIAIATCIYQMKGSHSDIIQYLLKAVAEYPASREAWTYLADSWMAVGNFPAAYGAAMTAMGITERRSSVSEEFCWGDVPKQIASSAYSRIIKR